MMTRDIIEQYDLDGIEKNKKVAGLAYILFFSTINSLTGV